VAFSPATVKHVLFRKQIDFTCPAVEIVPTALQSLHSVKVPHPAMPALLSESVAALTELVRRASL